VNPDSRQIVMAVSVALRAVAQNGLSVMMRPVRGVPKGGGGGWGVQTPAQFRGIYVHPEQPNQNIGFIHLQIEWNSS
jgi:hypothetical protein